MSSTAELVSFLAKRLVDDPEAVRVEEVEEDGDLVIRLYVSEEDRGQVIGRRGRMVHALRTVVRAAGARGDRRVRLEIVE